MKPQFFKHFLIFLTIVAILGVNFALSWGGEKTETAIITTLPAVPPPISRQAPSHVVVNLEATEYVGDLTDDAKYQFWGYNGTVPGPMIRVRAGDTVEIHLHNPETNTYPHNIDFHAVNGPGGGAGALLASPGQTENVTFKALLPGLYMYHCASPVPNIPAHIANGMYGMILVEPEGGLPKVDHEYAVIQSEFFTKPTTEKGVYQLSMEKGLAENPDYVVFNGKVGALTGKGELKADVGDTVRLYFGNIGPNAASSFHIIGEIFDSVHLEGDIGGIVNQNVQTTLVPSAGSTILEFKIDVPGTYILVDHSIFRVAKGAIGFLTAEGEHDHKIFSPGKN